MKITLVFLTVLTFGLKTGHTQDFVKSRTDKKAGVNGEAYPSLTFDGAWCWYSDPRAVYYEGKYKRTYGGWIDSHGDVHVGYYDHETKQTRSQVIYDGLQVDDHNNPALLFDKNGRLKVFFCEHATNFPIHLYSAKNPEDIREWEEPLLLDINDMETYKGLRDGYTYQHPVYLAEEDKYYLFWRGADFKPNYSVSSDGGQTWSKGKIFILPERKYKDRRPYLKVYSGGEEKIHFAFTDGHPRREQENSIYYMYYQNGALHKANGEQIRPLGSKPVAPGEASMVYNAQIKGNPKSWIWDVAQDENNNPVLAYAKFPNDTTHIYCYATWNGEGWSNYDLVNSGKWFPKTPEGMKEREPNYSGGISIDQENTNTLYLSVKRDSVFEIEKWMTGNGGKKWKVEPVTKGSFKDNIRPVAVRNADEDNPLQVLWLANSHYVHYTDYLSAVKMDLTPQEPSHELDSSSIVAVMQKVADWQLANPAESNRLDWTWGAFYTGLTALYKVTNQEKYLNEIINLGQKHNWKLMNDIYHADRLTIAQSFVDAYKIKKDPGMLEKVQWVMDMHVDRKSKADVRFEGNPYRFEWWTWCDALYMAPPAFAKVYDATGDEKYLKYMDKHWWKTSDYLYSEEDSLYYRDDRFFDKKTDNGKKVFWGRGNGWVIAGLARVIPYLPEDYKNRDKFIEQYREMAYKLLSIQRDHGLWTASLHDPEQLPTGESSASSFFTFALAWGINKGILPESEFKPAVEKAWKGLVQNVNTEGRLGYVQQVAGSPYPFYAHQWHVYASGAFLLAGKEMIELVDVEENL